MKEITIIGAGLAGSEAAWQVAHRGIKVKLIEMRPRLMTKAHHTEKCAELVCSNSFRGASLTNAVGLLKEELRQLNSLIMEAADYAKVPAGGALAVDRELFSEYIDNKIKTHPLIEFCQEEFSQIPQTEITDPLIIATGPLTSKSLITELSKLTGETELAFFDAISPIILGTSIDFTKVFRQSRYNKGGGDDYLNIALNKEEYDSFIQDITHGEKFGGHEEVESDMVDNLRPFEGCMPIEEMVARGEGTLRFGPLKPTGIVDPNTDRRPYAVVQLRQDDKEATLWSMVGMQTRLKHPEQKRIFSKLPGLHDAEFVRLGSVHRNSFINSPKLLKRNLEFKKQKKLLFAGQITGVEGYVESTACGLVAGLNALAILQSSPEIIFPINTAIGSLMNYITDENREFFQPMNISFGLMPSYSAESRPKGQGKDELRLITSKLALESIEEFRASRQDMFLPSV